MKGCRGGVQVKLRPLLKRSGRRRRCASLKRCHIPLVSSCERLPPGPPGSHPYPICDTCGISKSEEIYVNGEVH